MYYFSPIISSIFCVFVIFPSNVEEDTVMRLPLILVRMFTDHVADGGFRSSSPSVRRCFTPRAFLVESRTVHDVHEQNESHHEQNEFRGVSACA